MVAVNPRRRRKPWQKVLDEAIEDPGATNGNQPRDPDDEATTDLYADLPEVVSPPDGGLDVVVDTDDCGKKCVVEQAPMAMGDDGDDSGQLTKIKFRVDGNGDQERLRASLAPADMMQSGHGFMIDDRRSRPWKTAKRTHCGHCGGEMPRPDVSQYRCEFEPDASEAYLAVIDVVNEDGTNADEYKRRHRLHRGCQCSGCRLRWMMSTGSERGVGQPRKYCSRDCTRLAGNERNAWKRAVARAEKRGEEPPPEPEDRGLKFVLHRGPRSSVEGAGHRYTASVGLPWGAPRA